MAEVLQPLMSPTSTITMVHSRPSSSDFASSHQYPSSPRSSQTARGMYNGQNNGYRGASPPVQPYAFQHAPVLRSEMRSVSSSAIGGHRHVKSITESTSGSSDTSSVPSTKDDSVIGSHAGSLMNFTSVPDLSLNPITSVDASSKTTPGRYRRPAQQRSESGNLSTKAASPQLETPPTLAQLVKTDSLGQQHPNYTRPITVDDLTATKSSSSELAKRYRRRSMNSLDTTNIGQPVTASGAQQPDSAQGSGAFSTPTTIRPVFAHQRTTSNSSLKANQVEAKDAQKPVEHKSDTLAAAPVKSVVVPPRGSSDATKRLTSPSPLSRTTAEDGATNPAKKSYAAAARGPIVPSPAAQQLAALSDKDLNKGMKSKLRRAFSFGSAHELRRAAGENNVHAQHAGRLHQQNIDDGLDPEQREIARRQEAAGIGAGIYSGQGGFTGSTDNLSISSTASSASMMLRKMGQGAKKGAKSIKGLFRPKSVIGVPAADGPVHVQPAPAVSPTVGQVSMVTVEAERQAVNVNADVTERVGGGSGFPRLERNSIDAAAQAVVPERASAETADSQRRSIVGSDKDRAEVLAAVRKGILKRAATEPPSGAPDVKTVFAVDGNAPLVSESPASSMPSTPKDGQAPRVGTLSVNGDYFAARLPAGSKSMPNTPNGSARSISFSPRIRFHDAWSAAEYDRRGEIATCNRLTPMLAQQIKEELNTFKMEMEVHELSKPHTHFF